MAQYKISIKSDSNAKNYSNQRECCCILNSMHHSAEEIDKCKCSQTAANMLEAKNKINKHRWKLNDCMTEVNETRCLTVIKSHQQKQNSSLTTSSHQSCPIKETFSKPNNSEIFSKKTCSRSLSSSYNNNNKKRHASYANNYRKLKFTDWMTTCSVRKLLPIFILVNMLPFLYAGEFVIFILCV
ncbi:hypothetical protein PVAND_001717 [Polypedilum vanderplanki]|uniref:Uncharacterized protein n=1 Tax=Polypedilum vanderplanki TaxID=319348 RepID=A0A9J6BQ32_POLVA|nr:hypothetical protein PVAND_001717 [Polypedilum vanderplanki]